jgi:hypothetical protein
MRWRWWRSNVGLRVRFVVVKRLAGMVSSFSLSMCEKRLDCVEVSRYVAKHENEVSR